MIGKVQQDSFPCLRIRIDSHHSAADFEPHLNNSTAFNHASPAVSPGESLLPRGGSGDCRGEYNPLGGGGYLHNEGGRRPESTRSPPAQQQPPISRYKTEMCRPFQDTGVCKYGEKCQFAHGSDDLRAVNRHPKYKTDMCRTYHSVGFCPYGPRCHFIHALDELRPAPATPEKKPAGTPVKQLPMFGGPTGGGNNPWSFPGDNHHHNNNNNNGDMRQAVKQLNNFFNMHGAGRNSSGSSSDSSRSGSFCSDLDSPTSTSPPPSSSSSLRLPIFSRLA